jgi:hypothetical protein
MADADVAEGVNDAFVRLDVFGEHEIASAVR